MKSSKGTGKGGCWGAQSFSRFLVDLTLCSFIKERLSLFHSWVSLFECYFPGDWKCWRCVTTVKKNSSSTTVHRRSWVSVNIWTNEEWTLAHLTGGRRVSDIPRITKDIYNFNVIHNFKISLTWAYLLKLNSGCIFEHCRVLFVRRAGIILNNVTTV